MPLPTYAATERRYMVRRNLMHAIKQIRTASDDFHSRPCKHFSTTAKFRIFRYYSVIFFDIFLKIYHTMLW